MAKYIEQDGRLIPIDAAGNAKSGKTFSVSSGSRQPFSAAPEPEAEATPAPAPAPEPAPPPAPARACAQCGADISGLRAQAKYCGTRCRSQAAYLRRKTS